jgi:hypothetical protein
MIFIKKKKLKNQCKIENIFKNFKKYNKIYLKEKNIKYYMLFLYLAMITE